jgi:hypothetical protein
MSYFNIVCLRSCVRLLNNHGDILLRPILVESYAGGTRARYSKRETDRQIIVSLVTHSFDQCFRATIHWDMMDRTFFFEFDRKCRRKTVNIEKKQHVRQALFNINRNTLVGCSTTARFHAMLLLLFFSDKRWQLLFIDLLFIFSSLRFLSNRTKWIVHQTVK